MGLRNSDKGHLYSMPFAFGLAEIPPCISTQAKPSLGSSYTSIKKTEKSNLILNRSNEQEARLLNW